MCGSEWASEFRLFAPESFEKQNIFVFSADETAQFGFIDNSSRNNRNDLKDFLGLPDSTLKSLCTFWRSKLHFPGGSGAVRVV